MRWSWLCCQRRVVWRCMLPVFYALSSAIIVLQMAPSLVTMLTAKGRMPAHIFLPQFSDVTGYKKHTNFNQPDCSIFDFLTKVDPTAMTYDRSIFCSPESRSQDVFCKLFFIQVGLSVAQMCLECIQVDPKCVHLRLECIQGNLK